MLFVSSRAFSLSTQTFLLSTPSENSEATWKKATKCNKLVCKYIICERKICHLPLHKAEFCPIHSIILSTTNENISIYYTALCKQAKCGDQDVIVVAEEVALDDDDAAAAADDEDMYMHIAT